MSLILATALAVAAASIIILRRALGDRFWKNVGTYFIVVAAVFHFGTELLTALFPGRNRYRDFVTPEMVERWLYVAMPAFVILVVAYIATAPRGPLKRGQRLRFYDWRVCLAATVPLYLVAIRGGGAVPGASEAATAGYASSGVTGTFLQIAVIATTYAFVSQRGHLVAGLAVQSVAMLMLGQRLAVIAGLVVVLFLLGRDGHRPTKRQVWAVIGIGFVGMLVLSSARESAGREEFAGGSGPAERVVAIAEGVGGLSPSSVGEVLDDYVYRIDGNAMPAWIYDRQTDTGTHVGAATMVNAIQLAVPSFLNPTKLDSDVTARSEKAYIGATYGVDTETTDYLPTVLGVTIAYAGPAGTLLGAAVLGAALGGLDRWLTRPTRPRITLAASVLLAIVYYERGFEIIPIAGRGVITITLAVWAVELLRRAAIGTRRTRTPLPPAYQVAES